MVRMENLSEVEVLGLTNFPLPAYEGSPWAVGPLLSQRRVAIVSTAGLQPVDDETFTRESVDYRVIPKEMAVSDIYMSNPSPNFDRTGFQQDVNTTFPIDRLKELEEEGIIGSVADFHYSFMGVISPEQLEPSARRLAGLLKNDGVDAVVLSPV
jgi:D-proline reductase (dithiol) PrdB